MKVAVQIPVSSFSSWDYVFAGFNDVPQLLLTFGSIISPLPSCGSAVLQ